MIAYDKNFVYFLGYLWADGFIDRRRTTLAKSKRMAKLFKK